MEYVLILVEESDVIVFFFQAEDGIRDLVRSRGLGDVYKRQGCTVRCECPARVVALGGSERNRVGQACADHQRGNCLLYTSDAADERSSVDLGGRRIIKKKTKASERGILTLSLKHQHAPHTAIYRRQLFI